MFLQNTAVTLSLGAVTIAPAVGYEVIFADNSTGMISTAGGTITTTNAPALYISGPLSRTPIDLTLTAINVNGGANGIYLTLTSGPGLTVTGSGTPGSGGTIQNLTDAGILLSQVGNMSFLNMVIQNTAGNGIQGEEVTNFALTNSTIANTGSNPDNANIRFYRDTGPPEVQVAGTVTITGNTLSSPFARNIDIGNPTGTITNLVISNNVLTNTAGEGIRIRALGPSPLPAKILRATIDNNQITTSNATGLLVDCYNDAPGGTPEVRCGMPGSGTEVFRITNNVISGAGPGAALEVGLSAIALGATRANFHIAGNEILHTTRDALYHQATGAAEVTTTITGNTIVANNARRRGVRQRAQPQWQRHCTAERHQRLRQLQPAVTA